VNGLIGDNKDLNWLIAGGEAALKGWIEDWFTDTRNSDNWKTHHLGSFVDSLLDYLIEDSGGFPLLRYFRTYLKGHLMKDLGTPNTKTVELDSDVSSRVVKSVQDFIRNRV